MEEEIRLEIRRVIGKLEEQLLKEKILITEDISFNERLMIHVDSIYLRGLLFSFKSTLESDLFKRGTRKQRTECVVYFKNIFSETLLF